MSGVAAEDAVCPMCNRGRLHAAERVRTFEPHGKPIEVRLQTMACDACGETVTSASQHAENLKALAARKVHYGNLLMGEEILALRKRYGLTHSLCLETIDCVRSALRSRLIRLLRKTKPKTERRVLNLWALLLSSLVKSLT